MQLDGRRQSTNVDDRRGMTIGKAGGIGLGGLVIIGLITLLLGGNPLEVLQSAGSMMGGGTEMVDSGRTPTAEEEELAVFAKQILAGTEDVWTAIFKQYGRQYVPPKLVLYTDYVQTASGSFLWRGDRLQWAFATTDTIPKAVLPKGANDKSGVTPFNYGLALTKDGVECFRYLGAAGPRHFPCKVTRTGDETFYEVAIPWKELEYSPASGKRIAFSFIVFDRNSEAEVSAPYHIGLTRGIAGGQDASLYKVIVFED